MGRWGRPLYYLETHDHLSRGGWKEEGVLSSLVAEGVSLFQGGRGRLIRRPVVLEGSCLL